MKILLVDDDDDALGPLREEISQSEQPNMSWKQVQFGDAEAAISSFAPDLIVLDIFSGPLTDGEDAGVERLDKIWDNHFRPIVIYSADPSVISDSKYRDHPFIRHIRKGSGSELKVHEAIDEFRPLIEALQNAKMRIEDEFSKALRDVSPQSKEDHLLRIVERAARRRVAALVDEADPEAGPIEPWEQYVFPPVSENLRQGDVMKVRGSQYDLAECYRVVLTPSCDLVAAAGRPPKVDAVLVAHCISMAHAMAAMRIGGNPSKRRSRLQGVLNSGFDGNIVPLPALPGLIPMMAVDLRSLALIPLDRVRSDYDIVASVDSPFREAIAWAYMQVGSRPGLPDRDTESWATQAVADLSSEQDV